MNDQIINEVVKEVLIRIGHLKPLKLLKNADYDAVDLIGLEETYGFRTVKQEDIWKDRHPLLIPRLTNRQLISIYNGNPCDLVTSCVIKGLLIGAKIYVFEKDVELLNTDIADTPFAKRYKEAYELLKASGLDVFENTTKEGNLTASEYEPVLEAFKTEADPVPMKTSKKEVQFKDSKVLGQKQAESFINTGMQNLFIERKHLVTPLAKDMLREAGVVIEVVDS